MITLDEMTAAARLLLDAEEATAKADEELKARKETERKLREETIPGMFAELGVEKLTLSDGSTFSCTQEVYAAIPAPRREEAYSWLEENGFGGLIKTNVEIPFGKGELELARELLDRLATELGVTNGTILREVHPQTLKAFLKERLAAEAESAIEEEGEFSEGEVAAADPDQGAPAVAKIDLELFGARPVMTAKVKSPAKKKGYARAVSAGGGQVREAS